MVPMFITYSDILSTAARCLVMVVVDGGSSGEDIGKLGTVTKEKSGLSRSRSNCI